jgi:N-methylhydantoinase A
LEATVTDANLVLGRINPDYFLGGRMQLDVAAAHRALRQLADQLGEDVEAAALAIARIVDTNMIGALRSVLIERGLDPRDFTLCAFGGATPLHASSLIREMGIPRAIVPIHPAQFSAYGFILTDARVDRQRTTQLTSKRFDTAVANLIMEELIAESAQDLVGQGYRENIAVHRGLEMRYLGQNYELDLPVPFERFDPATIDQLWQRFHEAHETRFGFAIPGEIIEIVTYTVTAIAPTPKPEARPVATGSGTPEPKARRRVWFVDGVQDVPVYDRAALRSGQSIAGPALVEEEASVTVVEAGHCLRPDAAGHLLIDVIG